MENNLGLKAKGWTRDKIKKLELKFESLDYHQIEIILNELSIRFSDNIKDINKKDILWTIADDFSYEKIKDKIQRTI